MIDAPIPTNEPDRIKALHDLAILDTDPEKDFDEIAALAAEICEIDSAQITLIDSKRQWIKAKIGEGNQNLDRNLSFCSHTISIDDVFIVSDASKDDRFHDHPLVIKDGGVRFYAGMPLTTSNGFNVGAICVIDDKPRAITTKQIESLRILAKRVIREMELRKAISITNQQTKEIALRNSLIQQIVSIIGHDVKVPLNSLKSLMDLMTIDEITLDEIKPIINESKKTITSTETLLTNLLNWASSLQSGTVDRLELINIKMLTDKVVDDNRNDFIKKNNTIKNIATEQEVSFHRQTLEFVLRNLLLNANKFTQNGEIVIRTNSANNSFTISIEDSGKGIPKDRLDQLFNWQRRNISIGTMGEKGSGVALLLSLDLLKKYNSTLKVESTEGVGSTFSIVIPQ